MELLMVSIIRINTGSMQYNEAKIIAYEVLFKPAGLDFEIIEDRLEGNYIHLAALDNDVVVGYFRAELTNNMSVLMSQMAVSPEFQRKGIGKNLLESMIVICSKLGFSHIELNAREHVVRFYSQSGFKISGARFISELTKIPHYKMEMDLQN